ncbi:unnamed protein product [Adineta ricciae]|uniref:RabBD domain-containing protein n=1 Tax=Adineta ricciae TaxID=249248 RepID=A0A814HD66_ADIRI|nr:unnamed protein product [Adineta ricciae]
MKRSSLLHSSALSTLNTDEIRRIVAVIERDFKLRQKECKRIEELKRTIRQEYERVDHVIPSSQRCIRCSKSFRRIFDPREICSKCMSYVCQDCATYTALTRTWTCKMCSRIKELQGLTGEWFYVEIGKKFKRCGSAKIVRQLYKREKELADIDELDEDFGYGTLPKSDSTDSGSVVSYIVHDKSVRNELNQYAQRLILLLENLKSDLSDTELSAHRKSTENLQSHQQQISSEITRARLALCGPIRRTTTVIDPTYENDLRSLLIHKTEQVLRARLPKVQKNSLLQSTDFDELLSQIIFEKKIHTLSSSSTGKSSSSFEISVVDEEEGDDLTPTESSMGDEKSDSLTSKHRFIDTDPDTIKQSTQRVDNWHTNFPPIDIDSIPSDGEQVESSTWL